MPPDSEAAPFERSIESLRGAIRLHCYRMLGSSSDSDDLVQETMLRAWRAKESLADPALVKPWLYRIATNACIDELKKRPKQRVLAHEAFPAAENAAPPFERIDEPIWLEPMPDTWLVGSAAADPDTRYTLKESVALAFCAALQFLTPVQRATLLLRDVVGLSAEETATALELGVPAANSALFRARTAIEEKLETAEPRADGIDEKLLREYVRAFEDADIDGIVALFHDDIRTSMPPIPLWVAGLAENERFYRRMFGHLVKNQFRHLYLGANGQPALAFYRPEAPGKPHVLHAIEVVGMREGKVATVDHFMLPHIARVFGVPEVFPG